MLFALRKGQLFNNDMNQPKRPPLTPSERDEKLRLSAEIDRVRPDWERRNGTKLTQEKIGSVVGEVMRGEPLSQGAVWQYLSPNHNTRLNAEFVQACAAALGIDTETVGERFLPVGVRDSKSRYTTADELIHAFVKKMDLDQKEQVAAYAEFLLSRTEGEK